MNLILGNCLDAMREMPADSVDSIVTDPPYGLNFMGKKWDYSVPSVEIWAECLRVLKPGGHLLAFAGTRTQHRMAVNIEDAGFEIRDMIGWIYGSGFPKSLNVSKAVERQKITAVERQFCEWLRAESGLSIADVGTDRYHEEHIEVVNTATKEAPRWGRRALIPTHAAWGRMVEKMGSVPPEWVCQIVKAPPAPPIEHPGQWKAGAGNGTAGTNAFAGYGTALKPSLEPITVARKPLIGTVAANVLQHGTGALNVDGCRVGNDGGTTRSEQAPYAKSGWRTGHKVEPPNSGRWPANLIHDGSDEVVELFPQTNGSSNPGHMSREAGVKDMRRDVLGYADSGSAARFFYCAKTSKTDRNESKPAMPLFGIPAEHTENNHPTVKPTDLMRYLCRLVTPPGGVVLDPFMGSGSTGKAAILEGFDFIGCELDADSLEIARARIAGA